MRNTTLSVCNFMKMLVAETFHETFLCFCVTLSSVTLWGLVQIQLNPFLSKYMLSRRWLWSMRLPEEKCVQGAGALAARWELQGTQAPRFTHQPELPKGQSL